MPTRPAGTRTDAKRPSGVRHDSLPPPKRSGPRAGPRGRSLTGEHDRLRVTGAGQAEVQKVVTAARAWLATQLADWDALDDELLGRAMSNMARQYVDRDPQLGRSPAAIS